MSVLSCLHFTCVGERKVGLCEFSFMSSPYYFFPFSGYRSLVIFVYLFLQNLFENAVLRKTRLGKNISVMRSNIDVHFLISLHG